jgi:rhamnose utilization protein RhaD (predicted bifunctional aldolase and dehydrogenase)
MNIDLAPLRRLSAKLGQNLDLVQAGGGNTSVKDDGTLWVKASGKWLARATEEEMFLPVPLTDILGSMDGDSEYTEEFITSSGMKLRPSVETSMHAVLPQRVVLHVHSVRTIAWAVRTDVPGALHDRLNGLRWEWIPYVHPGVVLGREIRNRLSSQPDVLILGNHGLIVAADDVDSAETLLDEVERRLDLPVRRAPPADLEGLSHPGFTIAPDDEVHALATDPVSFKIANLGTFYPDQCVYLGPALAKARLIPGKGVLVENGLSRAGREVLISVKRVIERVTQPVRALPDSEVSRLLNWDAEKYRIALAKQYEVTQ